MSHNRAFWKAFHSLTHPLSILAILLLLFNDHWLRYAHPSWLTGKLGDFTWLVFAPFIAGLLFAWIVPRRWEQHTRLVGWLSIGFIGLWFATAKTIPFVHHLTTETLYAIVGWEGQLRLDITDLLTLPALIISWHIWRTASDEKVSLKPLAYVAFGLGILGTLASDSPISNDYGITEICAHEDLLIVQTKSVYESFQGFESRNGGLTWEYKPRWNVGELDCVSEKDNLSIPDSSTSFRWTSGEVIEISVDDGTTWTQDYELSELDAEIRTVYHTLPYNQWWEYVQDNPGPISAYFDQDSGNVLFAMGWNGLLIRTSQGEYHWVTVDDYGLRDLSDLSEVYQALTFELWLALALVFLIVTSSTAKIRFHQGNWRFTFLSSGWLGFVLIGLILLGLRNESIYVSEFSLAGLLSLLCLIFVAIPLSIGALWDIMRNFYRYALNIALAGIANGALFIFPFLLWTQGRIPRYVTAYAFSLMLTLLGLYATRVYLKRILPTITPEKLKNDAVEKDKPADMDSVYVD